MSDSNNHGTIEISKALIGCFGAVFAAIIGGVFLLVSVGVIQIGNPSPTTESEPALNPEQEPVIEGQEDLLEETNTPSPQPSQQPTNTPSQSVTPQPTSTPSSESSNPILSGVPGATQRCEEFQGTPVTRNSITTDQIETWRRIGKTDRNETARVIYCEIQQVPNFEGFTEGDGIPSGVIITADLGFNWNSMYPESLERLVHDGGGWGVFLSLKSFVVQHADDLPNDVGGQYWVVSR